MKKGQQREGGSISSRRRKFTTHGLLESLTDYSTLFVQFNGRFILSACHLVRHPPNSLSIPKVVVVPCHQACHLPLARLATLHSWGQWTLVPRSEYSVVQYGLLGYANRRYLAMIEERQSEFITLPCPGSATQCPYSLQVQNSTAQYNAI